MTLYLGARDTPSMKAGEWDCYPGFSPNGYGKKIASSTCPTGAWGNNGVYSGTATCAGSSAGSSSSMGAIIGGAVGGVVLLGAVAVGVVVYLKKKSDLSKPAEPTFTSTVTDNNPGGANAADAI